jgi:hypothetical protein
VLDDPEDCLDGVDVVEDGVLIVVGFQQANIKIEFVGVGLEPEEGLKADVVEDGDVELGEVGDDWLVVEGEGGEQQFRVSDGVLVVLQEVLRGFVVVKLYAVFVVVL